MPTVQARSVARIDLEAPPTVAVDDAKLVGVRLAVADYLQQQQQKKCFRVRGHSCLPVAVVAAAAAAGSLAVAVAVPAAVDGKLAVAVQPCWSPLAGRKRSAASTNGKERYEFAAAAEKQPQKLEGNLGEAETAAAAAAANKKQQSVQILADDRQQKTSCTIAP